jgi:hypothetical protein
VEEGGKRWKEEKVRGKGGRDLHSRDPSIEMKVYNALSN